MNHHLKTAVVRRARSLYTASTLPQTVPPYVVFDYSYSPRPSARKVPQSGQSQEQPPGSPATTLPTPFGAPQAPWVSNASPTPSYSVPPPLWLCPPLDAAWFPLALGIDVGPGPWDVIRVGKSARPENKPIPWSFECGAYGIPKKQRRKPSDEDLEMAVQVGEDSYFVREDALGVADGVGGWAHHHLRADSARFARMLMHNCAHAIQEDPSLQDPSPREILHLAYEHTVASFRATGTAGSSTALVALLRDGQLSVAHVGDCMLAVVRDGKFVIRSEDMQHSFNFPYQLGPHSSTTPRADAQLITSQVVPGDIVILASDGLGDNLWDEEVLNEVERFRTLSLGQPLQSSPQALGEALARRAKKAAEGTKDVPFGVRGRAAGVQFVGGKTDDISVVVAIVRGPSKPPPPPKS
ncbi:Protein phosphatase PTC7 homolog fig [Rhizoctonia solani]|uniref:Protein phosphatase n=1 Tax=Rhizoctonia solani TaxID=456999 RepID=A0A0K6G7J2_9AGAM|nr:Protein phosphatase PTC7 homolog fig [Rhizoctonia solani]